MLTAEHERLKNLEESLWRAETRFDRAYIDGVLAPNFFEFGRSGRRYTREDTLSAGACEIHAKLPLEDLEIIFIRPDTALVTYISEVQYAVLERANRCSVWIKEANGWRLHFHQGTPI